jgi:hypothetical protein
VICLQSTNLSTLASGEAKTDNYESVLAPVAQFCPFFYRTRRNTAPLKSGGSRAPPVTKLIQLQNAHLVSGGGAAEILFSSIPFHSAERVRERKRKREEMELLLLGMLTLSLRQATTGKQRAGCSYQNEPRQRQPRHRCRRRRRIEIHSGDVAAAASAIVLHGDAHSRGRQCVRACASRANRVCLKLLIHGSMLAHDFSLTHNGTVESRRCCCCCFCCWWRRRSECMCVCCYSRHLRSFTMYLLPATKNNKSQVKLLLFEALRNKSCVESSSKVFHPILLALPVR